jgi:hypothetical protein
MAMFNSYVTNYQRVMRNQHLSTKSTHPAGAPGPALPQGWHPPEPFLAGISCFYFPFNEKSMGSDTQTWKLFAFFGVCVCVVLFLMVQI